MLNCLIRVGSSTALDSLSPELAGVFIDRLLGVDLPLPDLAGDMAPDLFL